jgi:hypothetical protein
MFCGPPAQVTALMGHAQGAAGGSGEGQLTAALGTLWAHAVNTRLVLESFKGVMAVLSAVLLLLLPFARPGRKHVCCGRMASCGRVSYFAPCILRVPAPCHAAAQSLSRCAATCRCHKLRSAPCSLFQPMPRCKSPTQSNSVKPSHLWHPSCWSRRHPLHPHRQVPRRACGRLCLRSHGGRAGNPGGSGGAGRAAGRWQRGRHGHSQ